MKSVREFNKKRMPFIDFVRFYLSPDMFGWLMFFRSAEPFLHFFPGPTPDPVGCLATRGLTLGYASDRTEIILTEWSLRLLELVTLMSRNHLGQITNA